MAAKLTDAELTAAARQRADAACALIEKAQNDLDSACAELSALVGGVPVWTATRKMTERVHSLWYKVDAFRKAGRYGLDSVNVEALERRRAKEHEASRN